MPKKKSDPIDAIRGKLPKQERRTYQGEISLRAEGDNPTIGMFVPFGRRSVELWGFVEIIEPSAFTKTLQERGGDIVSVWNHDPNWVLGRQSNKTLALREADDGLHGDVTRDGEDAMHKPFARRVERRDVIGTSFGFETVRDDWVTEPDGTVLRKLVEVKLFDVSPVTFPAYPDSEAEKRSSAVDIATVKAGVDIAQLAVVLASVEDGKIPETQAEDFRGWLAQLEALVPPAAPTIPADEELRRRLGLRQRVARVA